VVDNARELHGLDWARSGAGFISSNLLSPTHSELLFIQVDGTSHVSWTQQGGSVLGAVPSPDGTHLAIAGWTQQSIAWMLTNF
jgi:hypothetical protein